MSSSCMGKELPKEKKWGIKNCRERKCPELRKNEDTEYPEDAQERCQVFNTMPGTLPCCIRDMDNLPPEEFLRHCTWQLHEPWEKKISNRKTPGPKNCPASCPYKISEQGEVFGKTGEAQWKKKPGTIWRCAFTGGVLGQGLGASCPCHVLDNPDQEDQIKVLRQIIEDSRKPAAQALKCSNEFCPDGALRCAVGETTCPVIKLPLAEMKVCPLWRIPAKLLPAPTSPPAEEPVCTPSGAPTPKKVAEETPEERLARGKAIREEVLEYRETMKKMSTSLSTLKEKPAEPEKKRKKPAVDTPALNVLYLEDCEKLSKRMEPESVDLIFTDPPYVTEPIVDEVTQWERAYVALHLIASKVLKPSGFLITYAPQAHLQDIMEILAYGSSRNIMVNDSGGTLDYFWIIPSLNGGATCKAHKWNALCLHKPILVYQKAPFKSPSKCFADVIRGKKQKSYHAWQQSVHDVLGILSRFMEPGQVVYDPYACTATTLIAGQLLGMQYIGAEIDPKSHAIGVRELQQRPMDLFTFGGEMPEPVVRETIEAPKDTSKQASIVINKEASKEARAALEKFSACLDCEAVDRCMRHDPHACCLQEFQDFEKGIEEAKEQPDHVIKGGLCECETTCGNCGHHKGRKTFHESCPRLPDLMFKGGKLSAHDLMEEIQRDDCPHKIPKCQENKKSASKKSKKQECETP